MVPSSVLIAMNFILSVLETSDGSLRKKRWLLSKTRFLLSDDEFLYPDLSRVFEACGFSAFIVGIMGLAVLAMLLR